MDFEKVERRFRQLQTQRDHGELDETVFRVEVAKLMFRDERGVFWMLDADNGTWFCNRGETWTPGDPRAEPLPETARSARRRARRRRLIRALALGVALLVLLGAAGGVVFWQRPAVVWDLLQTPTPVGEGVTITIASPGDGSQVTIGQEVAIELTIGAAPDLQAVDRVELQVNGQTMKVQPVRSKVQPGQTSLPLSQPWRPTAAGAYQVSVVALATGGESLGGASITVNVVEAASEALHELACVPGATFVADVTIPPGAAFPPGARMDKVWQVRNSGSCAWGVGYEMSWVEGEELGAAPSVPVPPTAAGESADLAVTFVAPPQAGTYTSVWQLQSPDGLFFGPTLTLSIEVEALAEESLPPDAPTGLQAAVTEDGDAVQLTWQDQSDNEDAFRVYREDMEASIGLAPANAELFVDEAVTCGNAYRYGVVAFNAAGASSLSETAEVTLPPCSPVDAAPTLTVSIVPTQVLASETFTVAFEARDDLALAQVTVWGDGTGDEALDTRRTFPCAEEVCAGTWPVTWSGEISATLTFVAIALDSSGQESEAARAAVTVLPLP